MSVAESILRYENCVGSMFAFNEPGFAGPVDLTLINFRSGSPGGGYRSVSMLFEGPEEPFLPQGNYEVVSKGFEPVTWFVTPVGKSNKGLQYEVIFTWLEKIQKETDSE